MIRQNKTRPGCIDTFHAFLVQDAAYDGELEIPRIKPDDALPSRLIPFSKAIHSTDYNAWVHFYEDDVKFERLWNQPRRYLPILRRYAGIITPDYSLYRDMPLVMQYWNIYRSRALGHWAQTDNQHVIVNVRFSDERTYIPSCTGVPHQASIAVGTHGCLRSHEDRSYFANGLAYIVAELQPRTIIVYGTAPKDIFDPYRAVGIQILQFDSDYALAHRKAVSA